MSVAGIHKKTKIDSRRKISGMTWKLKDFGNEEEETFLFPVFASTRVKLPPASWGASFKCVV